MLVLIIVLTAIFRSISKTVKNSYKLIGKEIYSVLMNLVMFSIWQPELLHGTDINLSKKF